MRAGKTLNDLTIFEKKHLHNLILQTTLIIDAMKLMGLGYHSEVNLLYYGATEMMRNMRRAAKETHAYPKTFL